MATPILREYPDLGSQVGVEDADLIATYRGIGPLKTTTAQTLANYVANDIRETGVFPYFFDSVSDLIAYATAFGSVGNIVYAGPYRYEIVSSGQHVTTAGGVKLIVLPDVNGYSIEAFGADMTGVASANTVLTTANTAAAAASVALILEGGTINLTASITVTADLHVLRGGKIKFNGGVVLTVDGNFRAGRYEVFTGPMTIAVGPRFAGGSVESIYPEWFGARATGPSGTPVDSAPAMTQALNTASRGTYGFTYRIELGQGVYHWGSTVVCPTAGLKHICGRGLETQVRGMDAGSGFPVSLLDLVSGTDNTRISDMTFFGTNRNVNFGIRANTSMKQTSITNMVMSSFNVACIKSLEWTDLFREIRFENCNVGLWIANVANNNDLTIETCRFVSCEMPLVTGPGANIRVNNCQFQGSLAAPYTKAFAYVWGGTSITFANCYFETQFAGGGLSGMTFTTPETVTIYAGIIFNNQPYFTDEVGTVTTTLSRASSPAGRSNCAIRECLLSVPSYYAAGAGGSGYTAGAVNIVAVGGTGASGVGTASVVGGAISNVTVTTAGTGYQIGDEVLFDQGGNTTARGRVLSTTTQNGLSTVGIGTAAAVYPGNVEALTIEHTSIPSTGSMFVLYNDSTVCEPGRIIVNQTPVYTSTTREFFLLGSNTTTIKAPLRNITIDNIGRIASTLDQTPVNYYPRTFTFTPTVSTLLRQAGRYQNFPLYRLTLNAAQQTSDAITGSITIGSSGSLNAELVGRRVVLACRKSESTSNVKLRLTLTVTSGANTITTQNYDNSTSFTKSASIGWEEVSIAIPANGGTLSWTIEVIAATAASQFVELIGLPILTMGGVSIDAFPRWLSEQPLTGSVVYDPPSLADGTTTSTTLAVPGARIGDQVELAAPYNLSGVIATAYVNTTNTVTILLNNESGGTVDLGSGTWRVSVYPTT